MINLSPDDVGEHTSLIAIPARPTRKDPTPPAYPPLRPYYVDQGDAGAYIVCAATRADLDTVIAMRSRRPARSIPATLRPLSVDDAREIDMDRLRAAGRVR